MINESTLPDINGFAKYIPYMGEVGHLIRFEEHQQYAVLK